MWPGLSACVSAGSPECGAGRTRGAKGQLPATGLLREVSEEPMVSKFRPGSSALMKVCLSRH